MTRKDSRGRNLKVGESQRKDGLYMYRYTDEKTGKRIAVYDADLAGLREKERIIAREMDDGIMTDRAVKNSRSTACLSVIWKHGSWQSRHGKIMYLCGIIV